MKTKVNIAKFRDQTKFAFDQVNSHWHSCVSDQEKILWFVNSFDRFNKLANIECSRAKPRDLERYEYAFDRFSTHCAKHEALWIKGRAYALMMEQGEPAYESMQRVLNTESAILQLSIIMPSSLDLK